MKHFKAIQCITKRIEKLQSEAVKSTNIIENPEMLSAYYYAKSDLDNFNEEILDLKNTIQDLTKT